MELSKAIRERRSVRRFESEPVKEEDLTKILDAARWAPSAGNMQPLELIVVKKKEIKRQLAEAALGEAFVADVPLDIVVCANLERSSRRYGKRGSELYAIQDTAAAAQNILLMAHALGYATCWVGAFNEKMVSNIIGAPKNVRPLAIIPVGKPAEKPSPPTRRSLEEITHEDKF